MGLHRSKGCRASQLRFFSSSSLGALTAAFALSPAFAHAQTAEENEKRAEDVIVVTGNASVIASSVDTKRNAAQVVDGITQLQIDRLPDTSIAEVLDRVVGVSSDIGFNSSQPRTVTVRGFDSRYNSTSIDGNPIWNSSRNNRGTQLDVFPSSVVSAVNVYKTVTPEYDANSVGGHIELRTLRAFDGGNQPYFTAQASYGIIDQDDVPTDGGASYRFDAAGKFTFGPDSRYGVVLGADVQQQQFTDLFNDIRGYNENAEGVPTPEGQLAFNGRNQTEIERQAYYGKLEAQATNQLYAFASLSYYTENNTNTFNRSGFFFFGDSITNATPTSGDFAGAAGIVFVEPFEIDRDTLLFSSGIDYRVSDLSSFTLRAGFVDYDHDEVFSRSTQFRAFEEFNGSYNLSGDEPVFSLDEASLAAYNDPSVFFGRTGGSRAFDFIIPHEDNVYSVRAQYDHNVFASSEGLGFSAGLNFRRLERDFDQTTELFGFGEPNLTLDQVPAEVPSIAGPGGQSIYFVDYDAFTAFTDVNGVRSVSEDITSDYDLREDVLSGFGSLIYDFGQLRLLAGVRIEHTEIENKTANNVDGVDTPVTIDHSYTDVLPNIQAIYDVNDQWKVRAAFTQTIARPDFSDFAFGQSTQILPSDTPDLPDILEVNGTNPFLEARVSTNYDASVEYYFGGGFASLGVFYKDFEDEIFTQRVETRDGNGNITQIDTTPLNNSEASVFGIELAYEHDRLEFLPGPLSNLGFAGNYTYLDGEWDVVFSDGSTRDPGGLRNQPDWLANLDLFYNQGPLGVNLAYRLRGDTFSGRFGAVDSPEDDVFVDGFNRLDLQVSYDVGDRFQVFAEAKNLTDTFYVERFGDGDGFFRRSLNPGRFFWLGVKYDY